jgi:hypothetical protein
LSSSRQQGRRQRKSCKEKTLKKAMIDNLMAITASHLRADEKAEKSQCTLDSPPKLQSCLTH